MSSINYAEKIPNNVDLQNDRTLQRALEHWQPHFLQWWHEMGPSDFETADVYLRTAISVDAHARSNPRTHRATPASCRQCASRTSSRSRCAGD